MVASIVGSNISMASAGAVANEVSRLAGANAVADWTVTPVGSQRVEIVVRTT